MARGQKTQAAEFKLDPNLGKLDPRISHRSGAPPQKSLEQKMQLAQQNNRLAKPQGGQPIKALLRAECNKRRIDESGSLLEQASMLLAGLGDSPDAFPSSLDPDAPFVEGKHLAEEDEDKQARRSARGEHVDALTPSSTPAPRPHPPRPCPPVST